MIAVVTWLDPCWCKNPVTLRDLGILADQSAEPVLAENHTVDGASMWSRPINWP